MSCKCIAIRRCTSDIKKVTKAIKDTEEFKRNDDNVNRELIQLSELCAQCFSTFKMQELREAQEVLNDVVTVIAAANHAKQLAELTYLTVRCAIMVTEDVRFHASLF